MRLYCYYKCNCSIEEEEVGLSNTRESPFSLNSLKTILTWSRLLFWNTSTRSANTFNCPSLAIYFLFNASSCSLILSDLAISILVLSFSRDSDSRDSRDRRSCPRSSASARFLCLPRDSVSFWRACRDLGNWGEREERWILVLRYYAMLCVMQVLLYGAIEEDKKIRAGFPMQHSSTSHKTPPLV